MIRPLLLTTAALLAALPAQARFTGPVPRETQREAPRDCAINVAFGSYAMGIDRPTLARMDRLLQADRRVRRVTRHPWGREGELTLCIYTRGSAGPLARQLRAMIPARPRGPVTVTLRSSQVY